MTTETFSDGLAITSEGHSVYGMPISKWRECPKLIWWAFRVCWFFGMILVRLFPAKLGEGAFCTLEELKVGTHFEDENGKTIPFWKH